MKPTSGLYNLINTIKTYTYDSLLILNRNKWNFSLLRLGAGCLMIAFLAILVTVTIYKSAPNNRKLIRTTERKEG
jgi:hypothetical protein